VKGLRHFDQAVRWQVSGQVSAAPPPQVEQQEPLDVAPVARSQSIMTNAFAVSSNSLTPTLDVGMLYAAHRSQKVINQFLGAVIDIAQPSLVGTLAVGATVAIKVDVLPPVNSVAPVASGVVKIGQTLTSTTGVWTNTPTSFAYQWTRDGSPIAGATSSTYTVASAADVKTLLRCEVTAINGAGSSTPSASNSLASTLRPAYLIDADAAIWVHTQGISTGIAAPVSSWASADGAHSLTQAITAAQPIRLAGGVDFDGADDAMAEDGIAGYFAGAHTVAVGATSVQTTSTTQGCLWMASTDTASATDRNIHVQARGTSASAVRWRYYSSDGVTPAVTVSLQTAAGASFDLLLRNTGLNQEQRADTLTNPLVAVGTDTRGGAPNIGTWDNFGVGARRFGTAPTVQQHWLGTLQYLVVYDRLLTDGEAETLRQCLAAEGVL
jgi:hypothetical protein